MRQWLDTVWQMSPDLRFALDEVLACDDRVIAFRAAWVGTNIDGGGPFSIPLGLVIHRDGMDLYEPDDRDAMLARFEELTRRPDRVLGDALVERLWEAANRSFNEHDFDLHLRQHASDFVLIDHRHLGWGELHGRDALAEHVRAALSASEDVRCEAEEVLACDGERVIAVRAAWRSGGTRTAGPWEIPVAYVTVFEDGLVKSHDLYETDEVDAILARYRELTATQPGS
jgi:hypothetical protein